MSDHSDNSSRQVYLPQLIAWEVTRFCLLACKHCRAAAKHTPYSGEFSREECFRLLDNIASFSKPIIILTGGEPMLRPDIYDLAAYGHGLGLTMVSQRPSEVSETIFAQCNNFIALRLTNSNDQNYVKRLFPDNSNAIADILPNLAPGEAVVVGDAVLLPSVIKMTKPKPEPRSQSVAFHKEWQVDWRDITFKDVIKRWIKE